MSCVLFKTKSRWNLLSCSISIQVAFEQSLNFFTEIRHTAYLANQNEFRRMFISYSDFDDATKIDHAKLSFPIIILSHRQNEMQLRQSQILYEVSNDNAMGTFYVQK